MKKKHRIHHAILWASAILASAILHAPTFLTIVLLPVLATSALIFDPDRPCTSGPTNAGSN